MSNEENDTIYELKHPVTQLNIDVRTGEDGADGQCCGGAFGHEGVEGPTGIPGPVGQDGEDGIDPNLVEGPSGNDGGPCEPGPVGAEPTQTVEINYAVADEPPQPAVGEAAQVPGLHIAAARAHGSATLHAREFGCGVITLTYDVGGAYRIHSEGINITYVIGFLQRAIMSLEASTRDRSPFAG